ncbi:restriction endonuclease [Streptomyces sp. NPDC047917]|uniref:restriction endonuclease n=1 Tax=Streptomyces sp. NPDC047917 TaxID=3365491 RepID=UPI00371A297C
MHINWKTKAAFPDYASDVLNEAFRLRISEATDDDLLAAYLHWIEGCVAVDFIVATHHLAEKIQAELHHVIDTQATPEVSPFPEDHDRARQELCSRLTRSHRAATEALERAHDAWSQMSGRTVHDFKNHYSGGSDAASGVLEDVGVLKNQVNQAERNMLNALAVHRDEMHRVALLEHQLEQFLNSDESHALQDIHVMSPAAFEQTVAGLVRRDGLHVIRDGGGSRDLGADVIAVTPDNLRVVIQCKHRQAGLGKVGSPDMQTLNGTARPEHKADIVVAVTNGTFTKPASDFAYTHDIHLLDQERLQRWATWGEPLLSVLQISTNTHPSAPAA